MCCPSTKLNDFSFHKYVFSASRWLLIVLSLMMAYNANSQVVKSSQIWTQGYFNYGYLPQWTMTFDGGYRWVSDLPRGRQYIVRISTTRQLPNGLGYGLGIANLGSYLDGDHTKSEMRSFQDFTYHSKWDWLNLSHRLRAEQRFFRSYLSDTDDFTSYFRWRWRYRILATFTLVEFTRGGGLSINLGDEVMIHTNDNIGHQLFDQNRLLFGPSWKINDFTTVQLTGNLQYASTTNPDIYHRDMIWWIGMVHRIK